MDYVYAVLLLHSAGKEITKENMTNIAKATEGKADDAKIDMIIESLKGKNIEEILESASSAQMFAGAGKPAENNSEKKEEIKEEKKEEVSEDEAAAGLDALFG